MTPLVDFFKHNKRLLRDGLISMGILAPILAVMLALLSSLMLPDEAETAEPETDTSGPITPRVGYPERGADVDTRLLTVQLPPPPLDALPYEVRSQLDNGPDVDVKRRWMWLPEGRPMRVEADADGELTVIVPQGALWWKEFYLTTDRGTFLIERRIIERTQTGDVRSDEGWRYYTAYHRPPGMVADTPYIISSTSTEAAEFVFNAQDWLPTQHEGPMLEVRFEDMRGEDYRYVFPGTYECSACHAGAAGAYPNLDEQPIRIFGLHPNNLTESSFNALMAKGWLENGDLLLDDAYPPEAAAAQETDYSTLSVDVLTTELVAQFRNNCTSCHVAAEAANASHTRFILDPNRNYSTVELRDLLNQPGIMMGADTLPIVTPGNPSQSEILLRLHGEAGRRRMPPIEGGLPEIDDDFIQLLEAWIVALEPS